MNYKGRYEVEAYKLTKDNIEEMAAWTKWNHRGELNKASEQYLCLGDKRCDIGDYIVKQIYTGNQEFYVLSESKFLQIFTPINN